MIRILMLACLAAAVAAAEPTRLRVGFNPWVGFAPAFVALEGGIFAKHGLQVELVAFQGPADSIAPLIAGHLDATLTTLDAVILANRDPRPAVVIPWLVDASAGGDGLVARTGIAGIAELKGKRVAAAEGQINHLLLLLVLERAGLKPSDVDFVNMGADDAGAAVIAGRLDAAATWEPWLSQVVEKRAGTVLATSTEFPGLIADCLAVTRERAERGDAPLKALVAALDEAVGRIAADAPGTAPMIAKHLGIAPEAVAPMLAGAVLYDAARNRELVGAKQAAATLQRIGDFLIAQQATATTSPAADMLDARFLP